MDAQFFCIYIVINKCCIEQYNNLYLRYKICALQQIIIHKMIISRYKYLHVHIIGRYGSLYPIGLNREFGAFENLGYSRGTLKLVGYTLVALYSSYMLHIIVYNALMRLLEHRARINRCLA